MKTRAWKMADGGSQARRVLECGPDMSGPLSTFGTRPSASQSAGGPAHSKTWRRLVASLVFLIAATIVNAQTYSIDWSTIDGGGGTSTGGVYSVSGTIGQPDAGKMSGGKYSVDGGFWGLIAAVQSHGAPLLTITLNSQLSTINVSWPSPLTGWTLQQNTNNVSSVNWSNVTATIQDDGTTKTLIVNPPAGNRFYRLHKP